MLADVRNLAAAYMATGEPEYARKAGIILERVGELSPAFDFATQGGFYGQGHKGYVNVWHHCSVETRELALAHDAVFAGVSDQVWRVVEESWFVAVREPYEDAPNITALRREGNRLEV